MIWFGWVRFEIEFGQEYSGIVFRFDSSHAILLDSNVENELITYFQAIRVLMVLGLVQIFVVHE